MTKSLAPSENNLLIVVGLLMSDEELMRFASSVCGEPQHPTDAMETIVEHMLTSTVGWRHGSLFLDRALPAPLFDLMGLTAAAMLTQARQLTSVSQQAGLVWLLQRQRLQILEPIISKLARRAQNQGLRHASRYRPARKPLPLGTLRAVQTTH